MDDLIERLRSQLAHANAHQMLAAPVDLKALEALLEAVQRPALSVGWEIGERTMPTLTGTWCSTCGGPLDTGAHCYRCEWRTWGAPR